MSDFTLLTGPLYIGSMLNFMLFGCLMIQLYDYFIAYQATDRTFIKVIVYFVSFAEVVQLVLVTHTVYEMLVVGYGDPRYLVETPWSSAAAPTLNGVISCCVQIFFAWRIWILKKNMLGTVVAALIAAIALMQCGSSIAVSVQYSLVGKQPELLSQLTTTVTIWLSGSLFCDILIAAAMVTLLVQSKRQSSFRSSEAMINTLIINTVETGLVTAIVALLELIFFLKHPNNFIHVCLEYILGRLFSNVLLATLNGRQRVRNASNHNEFTAKSSTSMGNNTMRLNSFQPAVPTGSGKVPLRGVVVSSEIHTDRNESRGSLDEARKRYPL